MAVKNISSNTKKTFSRRNFLSNSFKVLALGCSFSASSKVFAKEQYLDIAFLHLEPKLGELEHNCQLIEKAMRIAAKEGVKWILTPELALTGYRFEPVIGLDWISHEGYLQRLQAVAAELKVNLFLSHLEQDLKTKKYFNTLFVISSSGKVIGKHHKINTIPISESWSQAGTETNLINVEGYQVGLLICADAWPDKHALALKQKGAELLISSANWAPGKHGPKDSWQKRSLETNLPLFVCNRTGIENTLDMRKAESVVVSSGEKLATHYSDESSILLIRWDMEEKSLLNQKTIPIDC